MSIENALNYVQQFADEIKYCAENGNSDAKAIITAYGLYVAFPEHGAAGILEASIEAFQGNDHHLPNETYIGPTLEDLLGKTLVSVTISEEKTQVNFVCTDGSEYQMYHDQDCCEHVRLEDVAGDFADLIGESILLAEEVSNRNDPPWYKGGYDDSYTWTFYKLATNQGYVTLRWLGESNGYYSEDINFVQTEAPTNKDEK